VIRCESAQQPHDLNIASGFSFESPALENASEVDADAAEMVDCVAAVADQPARDGKLARVIDRGKRAGLRLREIRSRCVPKKG